MTLPSPKPGLVIRYSFLWSHEQAEGAVEGVKDRPCVIVVAVRRDQLGDIETIVAPITHRPPNDITASMEIPATICRNLGLDGGRHWLRFDELNRFTWPGYDLRSVPGDPARYDYGMLPHSLFEQLRHAILARQKALAGRIIARNEA